MLYWTGEAEPVAVGIRKRMGGQTLATLDSKKEKEVRPIPQPSEKPSTSSSQQIVPRSWTLKAGFATN